MEKFPEDALLVVSGAEWNRMQAFMHGVLNAKIQAAGDQAPRVVASADLSEIVFLVPGKGSAGSLDLAKFTAEAMQVCLPGNVAAIHNVVVAS